MGLIQAITLAGRETTGRSLMPPGLHLLIYKLKREPQDPFHLVAGITIPGNRAVLIGGRWTDVRGPPRGLLPLPPSPTGEEKTCQQECTFKNPSGGQWAMRAGVKGRLPGTEEPRAEKQTHLRCEELAAPRVAVR